jgi:serine/threonine-protein kinase
VIDPSSPSNQLVGAVLNGRFKLIRLLGEGGMGAVFEADSLRGEGKRAIKVLHPEYTDEPQVLARFFAEAEAAQTLQHPNIARVFEAARAEDGTPYIVMELLQGMPLAAFVSKQQPMPMSQAAPILHEVLLALGLAHSRHIIHRDLKPDNIFLVRDARGAFSAKVLDFGIAKVMDAAGGMGSKTRTGALLGTPGYMSPEQIKNSKAVDTRSDLWSIGSLFFELVTGAEAFPADNDFARLTATITNEPRPIEEVAPHLAAWGQFFRRALAKDLNARFQTAEEMDRSLMLLASGSPEVPAWSAAPTPRAGPPGGPPSEAPAGVARPAVGAYAQGNSGPSAAPLAPAAGQPIGGTKAGIGGTVAMAVVHEPPPPQPPPQGYPAPPPQGYPAPPAHPVAGQHPIAHQLPGIPGGHVPIAVAAHPLAPPAGAPGTAVNTHVSPQRPAGTPTYPGGGGPQVEVVRAPPYHQGVPLWVAGILGFVCLVLGFAAGVLVAG